MRRRMVDVEPRPEPRGPDSAGRRVPAKTEIEAMSRDELITALADNREHMRGIRTQLDLARQKIAGQPGAVIDREWLHRAETALNIRKGTTERLQARLGVLREEQRARNREVLTRGSGGVSGEHQMFLHAFLRAAKAELSPSLFDDVAQAARMMAAAGHPDATDCPKCLVSAAPQLPVVLDSDAQ